MLIWLIALLFVLMAAATGFYRGALRAAVSLVGLVVALFLAAPLGDFFQPILRFLGLQHPFVLPFVAPWVVFLLISAAAKGVAAALNAKEIISAIRKAISGRSRSNGFPRVSARRWARSMA